MTGTDRNSRFIALGIISGAHGVRGQVKIRSFTADPADVTAYGSICDATGKLYTITVTGNTKDALIASVEGVTTREAAEKLRNTELLVPRSALPKTGKNEYYHEDLVGMKVITEASEPYGIIQAVHNFGAGNLLAIKKMTGKEELLPFTQKTFPQIEPERGIVTIVPPEVSSDE